MGPLSPSQSYWEGLQGLFTKEMQTLELRFMYYFTLRPLVSRVFLKLEINVDFISFFPQH